MASTADRRRANIRTTRQDSYRTPQLPYAALNRDALMRQLGILRRQYPQYTNGVDVNFYSQDETDAMYPPNMAGAVAAFGGGRDAPEIGINEGALANGDPTWWGETLAKELGQANEARMIDTPERGDVMMNAWNYTGPRDKRDEGGLQWDVADSFGQRGRTSGALQVGDEVSSPADLYGYDFARALGLKGKDRSQKNVLADDVIRSLVENGILPQRIVRGNDRNLRTGENRMEQYKRRLSGEYDDPRGIMEDDPRWNPFTMGNRRTGPGYSPEKSRARYVEEARKERAARPAPPKGRGSKRHI